jgi:hypothetical protein
MTISKALILASVICFAVAAFGVTSVPLVAIGLALFASGHLV